MINEVAQGLGHRPYETRDDHDGYRFHGYHDRLTEAYAEVKSLFPDDTVWTVTIESAFRRLLIQTVKDLEQKVWDEYTRSRLQSSIDVVQ